MGFEEALKKTIGEYEECLASVQPKLMRGEEFGVVSPELINLYRDEIIETHQQRMKATGFSFKQSETIPGFDSLLLAYYEVLPVGKEKPVMLSYIYNPKQRTDIARVNVHFPGIVPLPVMEGGDVWRPAPDIGKLIYQNITEFGSIQASFVDGAFANGSATFIHQDMLKTLFESGYVKRVYMMQEMDKSGVGAPLRVVLLRSKTNEPLVGKLNFSKEVLGLGAVTYFLKHVRCPELDELCRDQPL